LRACGPQQKRVRGRCRAKFAFIWKPPMPQLSSSRIRIWADVGAAASLSSPK
jgi:hypothetical protein